jgi:predicted branched-subunit amino acid permease
VASLVAAKKESTVPMTYGIATLSSVLGSSFAMTAITNTGFSIMIFAGAAGYASVALIYVFAKKMVTAES